MAEDQSRWLSRGEEIEIKASPAAQPLGPEQHGWLLIHESDLGAVDAITGLVKVRRSDFMRAEIHGKLPQRPPKKNS